MKKFFYGFCILLLAGISNFSQAQTSYKIAIQFWADAVNNGGILIYSDSVNEGQVYTIKQQTLPSNYSNAQGLYDALVGTEFYFESGSLNQNITVMFVFTGIDLSTGTFSSDFNANFFFDANFAIYDSSGKLQQEPFKLNAGKFAILKIMKTTAFNNFIAKTGINITTALKLVYEVSTGFDLNGITTYDSTSSITAEISHFSHIVGSNSSSVTAVEPMPAAKNIPSDFALKQNYPNPFNPSTRIEYDLPLSSHVQLNVYNVLGVKVATLVDGIKSAGVHTVTFTPDNLSSGLYIYELKTDRLTISHKMLYLK